MITVIYPTQCLRFFVFSCFFKYFFLLPSLYIVNPTMLAYIWNFQLAGTFFNFFLPSQKNHLEKILFFLPSQKKITWKKGKKVELCTDRHIWLIFMFRISIQRTWCEESNEHIFSNGKWSSQKLFLKWSYFFSKKKSLSRLI